MTSSPYLIDVKSGQFATEPIRVGFGRGLLEAGRLDDNVVALCADLTESTQMHLFRDEFPERFIQVGVAEQNLVTVASGMAAMGKIPFTSSYAAFSPGRNWEQIRTTICLNQQNVKIIGSHAGISVGPDGATHQMLEDIALMRALPNMMVIAPADSMEAEKATLALANSQLPAYMRLAREATPIITTDKTPFDLSKALILKTGEDISIFSTGTMSYHALIAAGELQKDNISAEVIHIPVIKPLDEATLLRSAGKTQAIVTAEEAQITGGLGGAVAELMADHRPVPIKRIGVKDRFGESGQPQELLEAFGLTASDIALEVKRLLKQLGRH